MIILSEPIPLIWYICHLSFLYSRPLNQRRALLRLLRRSPPLIQRELLQIIRVMLLQCQGHHLSFQVRAHQYLTGLQHNQARRWVIFFNLVSCKVYILVIKYNVSFCLTTSLWFTWCLLPIAIILHSRQSILPHQTGQHLSQAKAQACPLNLQSIQLPALATRLPVQ